MKYFEFGQQNETLMVLLHGGGVCYPDPDKAMQEAFRVLKPGGFYILSGTGVGGIAVGSTTIFFSL